MGMVNDKSVKTTIRIFIKDYGREPTFEELRELLAGRSIVKKNEEQK